MRNFEIPLPSDATGEVDAENKKRKFFDADRAVEAGRRLSKQEKPEDVERGLKNADEYQPDTQKQQSSAGRLARIDPERAFEQARKRKEEEAKAVRVAREQQMKAEDQKKIEEIRSSLGLPGVTAEASPLLEGAGWHEVPPPAPPVPSEQAGKKEGV